MHIHIYTCIWSGWKCIFEILNLNYMKNLWHYFIFNSAIQIISLLNIFVVAVQLLVLLVTQSCPALCNSMDCSPPDSSLWNSLGKNTGVGCHALQGIFLTQGSNPCLLMSPALGGRFSTTSATWEAHNHTVYTTATLREKKISLSR